MRVAIGMSDKSSAVHPLVFIRVVLVLLLVIVALGVGMWRLEDLLLLLLMWRQLVSGNLTMMIR
jgi:hypothetical protein